MRACPTASTGWGTFRFLMMKKLGRFLLFPLFISITYAAFTAEAVTFADLASQLSYRTAWRNLFKGEKHVPAWVRLARGKSSPYSSVLIAGKNYVSGEMCKPHHCGSHRFYGIFSEDQKQAWGLLVTIKIQLMPFRIQADTRLIAGSENLMILSRPTWWGSSGQIPIGNNGLTHCH